MIVTNTCSTRSLKPGVQGLVRSVNLANLAEAVGRVELVLAGADHEPRVALDLVRGVHVGHGVLEEAGGLVLGSRAGVETELGDPDGLAVDLGGLLDLSLEAVNGGRLVDVVEVDVGGVHDRVGAGVVEVGEPAVRVNVSMKPRHLDFWG